MSNSGKLFYEFGLFVVDVQERLLLREGEPVPLTHKAFDTLQLLLENRGRVLRKEEMMNRIWPDSFVEEATLAQNVFTLRKILGEKPTERRYIETVPRRGYRFVARVREWVSNTPEKPDDEPVKSAVAHKSLAVLPFKSLIPGEEYDFLGMAMADALITKLSNIRGMHVRPSSTVVKYTGLDHEPISAGKELNVYLVLDGRTLKFDDRIRLTVQLIDVEAGEPLWADKFDERFTDIFTVQDQISEQVVKALTLRLTTDEKELLAKHHTKNSEANQEYTKGKYQWSRWTEDGFTKSILYFERAIELDPNYALAYAALSDTYIALSFYGHRAPDEAMPHAKAAAERSLEIDNRLAEGYLALAAVLFFYDWDWEAAERAFIRAIELNEGYATAHHGYGLYLVAMGRFDEARAKMEQALALDPASLLINTTMGFPFYFGGQYDAALLQYRKATEMNPYFGLALVGMGNVYVQKGMYREAIAEYKKAMALLGNASDVLASLGYCYSRSGDNAAAMEIVAKLNRQSKRRYVSPLDLATVYVGLGRKEEAFESLERACETHSSKMPFVKVNPFFESIRNDKLFQALLRRINLR